MHPRYRKSVNATDKKGTKMKAYLIGERSAGMTAVEIYDGRDLVWSHRWFDNGCSYEGYIRGLCDAWTCMRQCANWADFDGGVCDGDGYPVPMDDGDTTGIMLKYDTETGWSIGSAGRHLGQSSEIIDALMVVGLIEPDADHDPDGDVVQAIIKHIGGAI